MNQTKNRNEQPRLERILQENDWMQWEAEDAAQAVYRIDQRGIYPEHCNKKFRELFQIPEEWMGCSNSVATETHWAKTAEASFCFSLSLHGVMEQIRVTVQHARIILSVNPGRVSSQTAYSPVPEPFFAGLLTRSNGTAWHPLAGEGENPFPKSVALLRQPLMKAQVEFPTLSSGEMKRNGKTYVGVVIPLGTVSVLIGAPAGEAETEAGMLTPREAEMLKMASQGYPYRAIAGLLHVSEGTVKKTLSNAYHKTLVTSRIDLLLQMQNVKNKVQN